MVMTVGVVACVFAGAVWALMHRLSPLVRRWRRSLLPRRTAGPLSVRVGGDVNADDTVVLLHGLGATGDYFGDLYDGLTLRHRIVVVDLLGFGHSLDETRVDFGLDDHVAALEAALAELELDESSTVIAAHSMGSAVALEWAARHPDQSRHVVLWGPPMYRTSSDARAIEIEYGVMARLFFLDTSWAERLCAFSCRHRNVVGWMAVAMAPRWPVAISRATNQHTWPAYRDSLRNLVLEIDWRALVAAAPSVTIVRGAHDRIGDGDFAAELAATVEQAALINVEGAGHHVALTHPDVLFDLLEQ